MKYKLNLIIQKVNNEDSHHIASTGMYYMDESSITHTFTTR